MLRSLTLSVLVAASSAQWLECDNAQAVKGGSCNAPHEPCRSGSGVFNAGPAADVETCEGLCEKQKWGCEALQWHDAGAGIWANICLVMNQSAWHVGIGHQQHHVSACLKEDSFRSCRCSAGPPPPPSPPAPLSAASCITARTAYAKAQQALGGRGSTNVYHSLDAWMSLSHCNTSKLPDVAMQLPAGFRLPAAWTAQTLFVSPTGSDSNDGSAAAKAFKTLGKAQLTLRGLAAADRAGATVNLLAGTYYLGASGSMVFTAEDTGTAGNPVTYQAYPAKAKVVISGGVKLHCTWSATTINNGAAAHKCAVPAGTTADSLFVDGMRMVRARYPNGDPLLPQSGYSSGAKTIAQFPNTAVAVPTNFRVLSANGNLISTGSVPGAGGQVTVHDIDGPRGIADGAGIAFTNSSRFNDTINLPYWATTSTSAIQLPPDVKARADTWSTPAGAVVKMMHPAGWGSWAFEVGSYADGVLTFSRGGNQEARGNRGTGKFFVENVIEELDAENEWFLDEKAGTLYLVPGADTTVATAVVEVPMLKRIIQFRGTDAGVAGHTSFVGVNISHSAPTYLEDYEAPSGGDWSIHRGGAVFLDTAEGVTFEQVGFDQLDGNGVFLSRHAANNSVLDSDFYRTGDTAIAAVGAGVQMNGTAATYPTRNTFAGNHMDTVGVYTKQTSCYFKSLTFANTITNNVCHNGPRAGINFNDGFMGGDELSENVIWAMVLETGDHGTFNSWDRREWFYTCPADKAAAAAAAAAAAQTTAMDDRIDSAITAGATVPENNELISGDDAYCFMPQMHQVWGNMFIGPAGWNMDHDDGSSEYHDYNNIVYQGGYKYRDGVMRNMTGNLMLGGAFPKFQVNGFPLDFFNNNYMDATQVCGPPSLGGLSGNTFFKISDSPEPTFNGTQLTQPVGASGANNCDTSPQKPMTTAEVEALAHRLVGLTE